MPAGERQLQAALCPIQFPALHPHLLYLCLCSCAWLDGAAWAGSGRTASNWKEEISKLLPWEVLFFSSAQSSREAASLQACSLFSQGLLRLVVLVQLLYCRLPFKETLAIFWAIVIALDLGFIALDFSSLAK
jgi:hypothetical protein